MLHIKMPFGYNRIVFDHSHAIFTGKIRVKIDIIDCHKILGHHPQLQLQEGANGCTTIKFLTTCEQTNDFLIAETGKTLVKKKYIADILGVKKQTIYEQVNNILKYEIINKIHENSIRNTI